MKVQRHSNKNFAERKRSINDTGTITVKFKTFMTTSSLKNIADTREEEKDVSTPDT